MLVITSCNFSSDTKPVKALDARTRILKLFCVAHFWMKGRREKGSRVSSELEPSGEGLSLERRMRMGQRLGWMVFAMLDPVWWVELVVLRRSVATFSSSDRKGWRAGYLREIER